MSRSQKVTVWIAVRRGKTAREKKHKGKNFFSSRRHRRRSEYIFCDLNGDPLKKDHYISYVGRLCKELGIKEKGTYVFRRDANCRFAHVGTDEINRGRLLGNSYGVNNSCYTFEEEGYLTKARELNEKVPNHWKQEKKQ